MIYSQMFPIWQGLEIVNPQAAERKVQAANAKYFSSTSGFHKIKKGDTWRKQCHFLVGSLCASVESVDVYLSTFFIISARSNLYDMFLEYLTWFYKTVDHCDVIVTCHLMICFILVQIGIHVYGIKSLQCMSCIVK